MTFLITPENLVNLVFIAIGIGVCGLSFLYVTISTHLRKEIRQYFQIFFLMIILYITSHLARQLMDGLAGGGIYMALRVVTFVEILTAGLMALMMSMLILAASRPEKGGRKIAAVLLAFLLAHAALLIADQFLGLIYYFDAANCYHRGARYLLSNVFPFAMLMVDVALLLRRREAIAPRVRSAFWAYLIAPIVAIVIQSVTYGIQFIIFATVIAGVYMFVVIIQDQTEKYEKQQKETSRIESELDLATRIQSAMLPRIFPAFPERAEFDVFASMDPAKEVGGDFYDFFLVDDDHLCLVVADVSGKGVPAALFMMASKIILANNAMSGKSPARILADTNAAICSNNSEEMFVTVWLGILELSTGKLTAANAGHEYPAMRSANGRFELFKDPHGLVIGAAEGAKYREYELQLTPGAKLFLYTDGVPEATAAGNELFGTERMVAALNEAPDAPPEAILKTVRRAVDGFVKDAEQFDDITMLCVEYRGKSGAENA